MDTCAEEARAKHDAQLTAMCEGKGRVEPGRGRKGAKDVKVAANKKRAAADARAKNKKRALGKGEDISSYLGRPVMSHEVVEGEDGQQYLVEKVAHHA